MELQIFMGSNLFPPLQPNACHDLLILEVSRSHSLEAPQSVGLLWTSDQLVADLYLTTHNTNKRQTSMPSAGFEPTISAGEQPQTYALDRAATGTGNQTYYLDNSLLIEGYHGRSVGAGTL
jgi:hypothetical protein